MSRVLLPALALTVTLAACAEEGPAATPAPSATAAVTAAATATASAAPTVAAPKPTAFVAPRPVPLGSSGPIQPTAPAEQQMMAIQYTLAMLAPQGNDPLTDDAQIDEIVKKLEGAVRTADKGKTPPNPVKATRGKRKIEVEMGKGCNDKTPANLLVTRASVSLQAAFDAGVFVIMCHDDKWECHQSTRFPADVLCVAAPRR
jgi:hypothetical protein